MKSEINEIDNYLRGKMNAEQKLTLEKRIKNDKALASQVNVQKLELRAAELLREDKMRAMMSGWEEARGSKNEKTGTEAKVVSMSSRAKIIRFAVAASILLLVGMFGLMVIDGGQKSDILAMHSFEKTAMTDKSSNPSTFPDVLQPGLKAMQAGDYEKAIEYFKNAPDSEYDELINMYIAESYYKDKNYSNAEKIYKDLASVAINPINRQKAEWYLILTKYTMDKNDEVATELLNKISENSEHSYYSHAVKFKKETSGFWQRLF